MTTTHTPRGKAKPCQNKQASRPKTYSEFVERFWNDIFIRCSGKLPTKHEMKCARDLSDRAALILYRERKLDGTFSTSDFLEALKRASAELIADHQTANREVVA